MQAIILAGGLGTRLKPLTKKVPKVMVPVQGEPFIVHLLRLLNKNGIHRVVLCIGYLGEQVKDYLGNGEGLGITIRYSKEREGLLGTGGALRQARNLLDESFYVVNGDTYLPINYNEVERAFINCGKKALMAVYDNKENSGVRNNVALDSLTVIRHQKDKFTPALKYADAGLLILNREVLDFIKDGSSISLEEGLYPSLIEQGELSAYITEQKFYDIGTPEHLRAFEEFLGEKRE